MNINVADNLGNYYNGKEIKELLSSLAAWHQVYDAAIKEIRTKLEILDGEFKIKYNYNPIHHLEYRLKSPRSIFEKLSRRDLPVTMHNIRKHITDIAGVRVICNYVSDIDLITSFLLRHEEIKLLQRKDYIKAPKNNGYRSLHLIVEIPILLSNRVEKVAVEIQIRTIGMDYWASLEHHLKYKASHFVSDEIRSQLKECAEIIASLDEKMQTIFHELTSSKEEKEGA
jgi:putative GTP pyrophosphokinase